MGRNLALGVATTIWISKKKNYWTSDFDLFKNEEKIKEELKNLIDISAYDFNREEDKFVLTMKPEYFSNNIHDLIKELYPVIDCRICMINKSSTKNKIELDEDFNSKNYPIELKVHEDGPDEGDLYCDWFQGEDYSFGETSEWWLFKSKELRQNIHIDKSHILIWLDINKIDYEDETKMLEIMNKMARTYLKSKLSKNSFFYISG